MLNIPISQACVATDLMVWMVGLFIYSSLCLNTKVKELLKSIYIIAGVAKIKVTPFYVAVYVFTKLS